MVARFIARQLTASSLFPGKTGDVSLVRSRAGRHLHESDVMALAGVTQTFERAAARRPRHDLW